MISVVQTSEGLKILIAVVSCHRRRHYADAQRTTWLPSVRDADVRFFAGDSGVVERVDEVVLPVPDDYYSLPRKTREVFRWASARGYDRVFKTDDDIYIEPTRLLQGDSGSDYAGAQNDHAYASGFGYWVSRRAMAALTGAGIDDWAEDRWVGHVLQRAGIRCHHEPRYVIVNSRHPQNLVTGTAAPLAGNDVSVAGEFEPTTMQRVHEEWLASQADR